MAGRQIFERIDRFRSHDSKKMRENMEAVKVGGRLQEQKDKAGHSGGRKDGCHTASKDNQTGLLAQTSLLMPVFMSYATLGR